MAERFFFPMKPIAGDENHTLLLSGPISSGKTSLLFQFALNVANASTNNRVVFICHRKKIESNPPFLSQGIDPSSDVFNRIHMKYVDDDEGIRKYFAAFHLHGDDDSPAAVIIDDFGDYFSQLNSVANSRVRDMAMVRTLALCHNAIVNAKKAFCELVISETNHGGDSTRSLFIYKRWISKIFTIKGHGDGSFLLTSNCSSEKSAKYSIALQYLILEQMIDHSGVIQITVAMQRRDLLEDLIEEILSRVPARSLARLCSMSKRWNSLLKSRRFGKIHYANSPKESLVIMLMDSKVYFTSVNLHGIQDYVVPYVKVATQFCLKDPFSIRSIFHCDGLLLCATMDNRLVVWNPCSGETKWIKPRNNYYKESDFYALGYDNKSSCKKYKILRVDRKLPVPPTYNEYEIYDFTTDSWRVLGGTSDWYLQSSPRGVSLKGNTYVVAFDRVAYHGIILSFDFSTDRFRWLSLPSQNLNSTLSAAREDQLYLCYHYSTRVHVWVTTISTGSVMSWSRRLIELNASHRRDFNMFSGVSCLANEQNKLVVCCNQYLHASPYGGNLTCKSRCSLLLNYVPSLAPM